MIDQTLSEITGYYPLDGVKAKNLIVEITKSHVSVKTPTNTIVDDDLYATIKPDDSTWTVSDGTLQITFEKIKKEWWPHLVVSDPKIDIRKLEPEKSSLGDLDADTKAHVEKMMYDQRQQQMGLPTIEEQRKQQMLEKFKNQHPELDFSQLKQENINFK